MSCLNELRTANLVHALYDSGSLADRTRLLSVSSVHASSWLQVVPSPRLGFDLATNEMQWSVKWWLGLLMTRFVFTVLAMHTTQLIYFSVVWLKLCKDWTQDITTEQLQCWMIMLWLVEAALNRTAVSKTDTLYRLDTRHHNWAVAILGYFSPTGFFPWRSLDRLLLNVDQNSGPCQLCMYSCNVLYKCTLVF